MRPSIVILALAAVASASSVKRQIPACAVTCMQSANYGSCDPTDNACLCRNNDFVMSTYNCIASTCKGADLENAITAARALCAASGITLTQSVPASTGGASATAPAASSTAPASSTPASASASASATPTKASNGAIGAAGASGMVGAIAAVASFMFAL